MTLLQETDEAPFALIKGQLTLIVIRVKADSQKRVRVDSNKRVQDSHSGNKYLRLFLELDDCANVLCVLYLRFNIITMLERSPWHMLQPIVKNLRRPEYHPHLDKFT